jgi:hypothetical protein
MRRNGMVDGFLRIVVSRGTCAYISLDPRVIAAGPTLVMLTRGAAPPRELSGVPTLGGRCGAGHGHPSADNLHP